MNIFMLLGMAILMGIIPFFIGNGILVVAARRHYSCSLAYICGCLGCIVISGVTQLYAIMTHASFTMYKNLCLLLWGFVAVWGVLCTIFMNKKVCVNKDKMQGVWKPLACLLLFGTCMLLFSMPDLTDSFILETTQTTLATDTIYEYNSFTGMEIAEGMPIRQKILTLSFLYAILSKTFLVSPERIVYFYIPLWVLIQFAVLLYCFATSVWKDTGARKCFLWVSVGMTVFAGIAPGYWGYELFRKGAEGGTFTACIIVPMVILGWKKRIYSVVILALGAELFCHITTYGLGFGAVTLVLLLLCSLGVRGMEYMKNTRKRS